MLILEAIVFFGFIAATFAAGNIPLCLVLFAISFSAGMILERKADKHKWNT